MEIGIRTAFSRITGVVRDMERWSFQVKDRGSVMLATPLFATVRPREMRLWPEDCPGAPDAG